MRKVRPYQADVYAKNKPGSLCPYCKAVMGSWSEIARHWSLGHFDYETDEPLLPGEAARVLASLVGDLRVARGVVRSERVYISSRLERLEASLAEIETKVNEICAVVGGYKP